MLIPPPPSIPQPPFLEFRIQEMNRRLFQFHSQFYVQVFLIYLSGNSLIALRATNLLNPHIFTQKSTFKFDAPLHKFDFN